MGLAKRAWEKKQSQIFDCDDDKYVCCQCITDEYLKNQLKNYCKNQQCCSYCGSNEAAPIEQLCELIQQAISVRYCDPAEELPYESAEGGYQGEVLTGYEIMLQLDEFTDRDQLLDDVANYFSGAVLCQRDYYSLTHGQTLSFGWSRFEQAIMHETRFLFFSPIEDVPWRQHDEIHPTEMLFHLGDLFHKFGMMRALPKETSFIRARIVGVEENPKSAEELGSVPPEKAVFPNRMSAVGISMFYAGLDNDTAVLETYEPTNDKGDKKIVLATFKPTRDLFLVDFTTSPDIPSYFDPHAVKDRHESIFLFDLIRKFTKPVERTDRAHIEYIPTQVVTEYVRHRLLIDGKTKVDGIIYKSSRPGGSHAVVIFAGPEDCSAKFHQQTPLLQLEAVTTFNPKAFGHLYNKAIA